MATTRQSIIFYCVFALFCDSSQSVLGGGLNIVLLHLLAAAVVRSVSHIASSYDSIGFTFPAV